jgi:hypothetical protein
MFALDGYPTPPANSLRTKAVPCKTGETPEKESLIPITKSGIKGKTSINSS